MIMLLHCLSSLPFMTLCLLQGPLFERSQQYQKHASSPQPQHILTKNGLLVQEVLQRFFLQHLSDGKAIFGQNVLWLWRGSIFCWRLKNADLDPILPPLGPTSPGLWDAKPLPRPLFTPLRPSKTTENQRKSMISSLEPPFKTKENQGKPMIFSLENQWFSGVYMYIHVYTYIRIYVYVYVYIYIHTYIRIRDT